MSGGTAILFRDSRLFQQLVQLFPNVFVLILKQGTVSSVLSLNHALAIDEDQLGNVAGLVWQSLQIFKHRLARRISDRKAGAELLDEGRDQTGRAGIKSDAEYLNTSRAVVVLNATQDRSGALAVWSGGVKEFEKHDFSGELAEQKLAAVGHRDYEFGGRTRDGDGGRCGCQEKGREERSRLESHTLET